MTTPPVTNNAEFTAKIDQLEKILNWVHNCIEQAELTPTAAREMHLVMEEAVMNIILHAYQEKGGLLELVCQIHPHKELIFTLKDRGPAFNPLSPPPRAAPRIPDEGGGVGLLLLTRFIDEAHYERSHPFNILTLTKRY